MKVKGQSSAEYLLVMAAFLAILASFTVPQMINPSRNASQNITSIGSARSACDEIASTMNGISTSGKDASDPITVSLLDKWSLETKSSPPSLKLGVKISGEMMWENCNLEYGFDDSISNIAKGTYVVVVRWGENNSLTKTENKIFINLNPNSGGGQWQY